MAGNVAWDGKFAFKYHNGFEHWIINGDGKVQDYYKNLTSIFEMSTEEFIEKMSNYKVDSSNSYYELWKEKTEEFIIPNFEYSNLYVTQKLMNKIPSSVSGKIAEICIEHIYKFKLL